MSERPSASQSPLTPELSIVVVNWNSLDYLRSCVRSILQHRGETHFEIVVVDNASTNSDVREIEELWPDIIVERSPQNLGFAAANNRGTERCSGAYLLFLNPDTEIIGPAISVMLAHLKVEPSIGIVGCKLLNGDGSPQTSCIQRYPTVLNQVLDADVMKRRWPQWKMWGIRPLLSAEAGLADVEVVSGACLMIGRRLFRDVAGFDEGYFMYGEDVDLCFRVRARGARVCYTGDATVTHFGGGASSQRNHNAWVAVAQREAILRFFKKTRGAAYGLLYRISMAAVSLLRLGILRIAGVPPSDSAKRARLSTASVKWTGVFRWALGLSQPASRS